LAAPGAHLDWLNPGLADFPTFIAGGCYDHGDQPRSTGLVDSDQWVQSFGRKGQENEKMSAIHFVFNVARPHAGAETGVARGEHPLPESLSIGWQEGLCWGWKRRHIHTFIWQADGSWSETGSPIALGHSAGNGLGFKQSALVPVTAGIAVTADGKTLVVANFCNDSISVIDLESETVTKELDLRPGEIRYQHRWNAWG